jgi:hypothetical protein
MKLNKSKMIFITCLVCLLFFISGCCEKDSDCLTDENGRCIFDNVKSSNFEINESTSCECNKIIFGIRGYCRIKK